MKALGVFFGFVVLTIVMTWPLSAGIASDVPGDLGDSLLNMWILGWGAESLPRVLTGQMSVREVWNANIFHPEPLALGFSEHLFGQVLQILPVYHLTGNLILCYNLLFLSTFALSGFAMYLFVREMTGNTVAGFFAGLLFAFLPYRIAQIAHIQILSTQWMPFALYGFRRFIYSPAAEGPFFRPDTLKPLALGTAALLMLNWSCGYYLLFFPLFLTLFLLHQMWVAGRLRDLRIWSGLVAAAVIVLAGTAPFLWLYVETQRVHGFTRPFEEIVRFSADVYGYLTAADALRLWGGVLRSVTKPENEVFLGFVPVVIGAYAVYVAGRNAWRASADAVQPIGWRQTLAIVMAVFGLAILAGAIGIIFTGGFVTSLFGVPIRATNMQRLLLEIGALALAILVLVPRARNFVSRWVRTDVAIACLGTLLACWLSLGPTPTTGGRRLLGLGLYNVLYDHVPGFDGLRAPARFAMIAALFLTMLAGLGIARLTTRRSGIIASVASLLFLIEAAAVPLPMNLTWGDTRVPSRVYPTAAAPSVYQAIANLPKEAVIAELPLGDPAWELRYVYYSTVHWRRIVNGYSGGFPDGYASRSARLYRLPQYQEEAWHALIEAGTTHVVIHRVGLNLEEADQIGQWLINQRAREIGRFDDDVLYELPRAH